jgi:hypothetical protein
MPTTKQLLSEVPEGDAREALRAEVAAGRVSLYPQILTGRTIIWLDSGPYKAARQAQADMMGQQYCDMRLFCDEWLALYAAMKNAEGSAA